VILSIDRVSSRDLILSDVNAFLQLDNGAGFSALQGVVLCFAGYKIVIFKKKARRIMAVQ